MKTSVTFIVVTLYASASMFMFVMPHVLYQEIHQLWGGHFMNVGVCEKEMGTKSPICNSQLMIY